MKPDKKKDLVPLYTTYPLTQPEEKTKDAKVSIPSDEAVGFTKGWSEELKL